MSSATEPGPARAPAWLTAAFLCLLVLPFHPYWYDFEQVRRGLLLVLAGACLLGLPQLLPVRGERAAAAFFAFLLLCTAIAWLGDHWFREARTMPSFQPMESVQRLAHWLALLVVLRLGAAAGERSARPFAILLAATALFGLLQRAGVAEVLGYGVEREPVSVFGNLNVAAEWTALAAMVVAVASGRDTQRWRALGFAALALAGAYAIVNHSRSALVALPIGLLLQLLVQRSWRRPWPLLAVLLGALLGLGIDGACARPAPPDAAAAERELQRGTATIDVRFEIAKGATRLFAESPLFGKGPGQFAVQYPRFRSQQEIELSSHGRQFATEVRTAHDDWLELLVDGGLPGLLLFAWLLFTLQRGRRDKTALLPLFTLLVLMLVRAPLWNAPAAVAALWLCGTPAPRAHAPRLRERLLAIGAGLAMLGLGVLPIAGNFAFVPCMRAMAKNESPDVAAAEAAAAWLPFEPRMQQFLAQERLRQGELAAARQRAATAVAQRPFDPQAHELLVEVLVRGQAFGEARQLVDHALRLDPQHPELRMWNSWLCMRDGAVEAAILAVVDAPHPMLRASLAEHFQAMAEASKEPVAAARYRAEHHALAALALLDSPRAVDHVMTTRHVTEFGKAVREAGARDVRVLVLTALQALALGDAQGAIDAGSSVGRFPPLLPWQRALFGDKLERLRSLATWHDFVDAR